MSKFVQPENQQLLWNISQKIPHIRKIFPLTQDHENWFKEVIEAFYQKRKHQILNKTSLNLLNKQVVQYMIDYIRRANTQSVTHNDGTKHVRFGAEPVGLGSHSPFSTLNASETASPALVPLTPRPQTVFAEPRAISSHVLEERQREYDNMLKRELPAEPHFGEMEKDSVIDNMDELVQQQMRERELLYFPPDLSSTNVSAPSQTAIRKPVTHRTLHIQKEDYPETPGVIPLETIPDVSIMMSVLLDIRNELRELRSLYPTKGSEPNTVQRAEELESAP